LGRRPEPARLRERHVDRLGADVPFHTFGLTGARDRFAAKEKAGIVFETGLEDLRVGYSSSIWLYIRLSWIS